MRVPFTYPTDFLKERDFGQKIEASFDFVKAHFRPLGKALLYIVLPLALVQGIAQGLVMSKMSGALGEMLRTSRSTGRMGTATSASFNTELFSLLGSPEYLLAILTGLLVFTLLILTVYGYLVLRLEQADPTAEVPVRAVWALVRRRFLGTLLAFFGLGICVVAGGLGLTMVIGLLTALFMRTLGSVGFGFLIVLVVYAAIFYAFTSLSLFFIIWVRERRGFFPTIGRCFALIWGKWWSTFGLLVVMSLIVGILYLLVYALSALISSPFSMITSPAVEPSRLLAAVAGAINASALLLLYPLLLLAVAFQYFNLVERKEGEGLHALVAQLGSPAPVSYSGGAAPTLTEDEGEY